MKRNLVAAMVGLLFASQVLAQRLPSPERRAVFRQAVDQYQMFVVAHCAPDEVRAYVAARADRDSAFVRSLRKTILAADYKQAVADRVERDKGIIYECIGPPSPPPPPPGTTPPPALASTEPPHDSLAEHFAAGDRQFSEMMRLRDELIGSTER